MVNTLYRNILKNIIIPKIVQTNGHIFFYVLFNPFYSYLQRKGDGILFFKNGRKQNKKKIMANIMKRKCLILWTWKRTRKYEIHTFSMNIRIFFIHSFIYFKSFTIKSSIKSNDHVQTFELTIVLMNLKCSIVRMPVYYKSQKFRIFNNFFLMHIMKYYLQKF